MMFGTNGTEAMRIDSSGRVGIGVVPSTLWSTSYDALQVGLGGSVYAHAGAGSNMFMAANSVYEGTAPNYYDKYLTSSTASKYAQDSGYHMWSTAASGTAGNAITWAERMRIDSSGNVGIGTSSPANKLHLTGESATPSLRLGSTSLNFYWDIGRENATTGDFVINSAANSSPVERMRIKGNGNLLLRSTDAANITTHSSPYLEFRAGQTNGQNVTLGKIKGYSPGGWGGDLVFETKPANGQVNDTTVERLRIRESGGITFNGDTAAANALDDYESGDWVPVVSGLTLVAGQTTAKYVKVGSFVFFSTQFIMPSTSSSTNMSVTGLPFLSNCDSSATMGYTTSTIYNPSMMVQGITTYFYRGGGSTYVQSQYSGAYVRFSGHYNTAA
tara:strand:- start:170 stop:1330 length:1161 start_codon:yes stop_codon:yes gene_type:complete